MIGIHGVGDPGLGELRTDIVAALHEGRVDLPAFEINWNHIVSKPLHQHSLRGTAIRVLAMRLARASLLGTEDYRTDPSHTNELKHLADLAFIIAELFYCIQCGLLLWGIPLLSLLSLFTFMSDEQPSIPKIHTWMFKALLSVPVIVTSFLLLLGMIRSIVELRVAPFWIALRQAILLALRPLILVAFSVFTFRWDQVRHRMTKEGMWIICTVVFVWPISMFVRLGLPSRFHAPVFDTCLIVIALWLFVFSWTLSITFLTRILGSPAAKILLDIFRYISDPQYRSRIQKHVNSCVHGIYSEHEPDHVILVAHSLGTVIAMDALMHSAVLGLVPHLTLVTMGSPLRRAFFRFFPGLYFPSSSDLCSAALVKRIEHFRWLNCYRPLDYVGSRLGGMTKPWSKEKSTWQVLHMHANYWRDQRVLSVISARLGSLTFSDRAVKEQPQVESVRLVLPPRHRLWVGAFSLRAARFATVAIPLLALFSVGIRDGWLQTRSREGRVERTVAHGVERAATVTYEFETLVNQEHDSEFDHTIRVSFRDNAGAVHSNEEVFTEGGLFSRNNPLLAERWHYDVGFIHEIAGIPRCRKQCETVVLLDPEGDRNGYFLVKGHKPTFTVFDWVSTLFGEIALLMVLTFFGVLAAWQLSPVFECLVGETLYRQEAHTIRSQHGDLDSEKG